MVELEAWAKAHKTPLIIGGVVFGGLAIYMLSKRQSSAAASSTDNSVTLATLHSDLQSIDMRLQQENAYLSSGSSMSPLVPSIDITDTASMTPEFESSTVSTGSSSHLAPGPKTTAVAARSGGAIAPRSGFTRPHGIMQPGHPGGKPFGGPIPPQKSPPHEGEGMGTGDYAPWWFGGSNNFPGDAADYFGLN